MPGLDDVRAYLDETDDALLAALSQSDPSASGPGGRWSAGQILEHLNRTEMVMYPIWAVVPRFRSFPTLLRVVDRANGALWRAMGMATVVPVERLTPANAEAGRFRAPVFLRPAAGDKSLDELLERRRRIRFRTLRAVAATGEAGLSSLRWSHPLMGSFTLMEFAQFLGVHERHHLPQILQCRRP